MAHMLTLYCDTKFTLLVNLFVILLRIQGPFIMCFSHKPKFSSHKLFYLVCTLTPPPNTVHYNTWPNLKDVLARSLYCTICSDIGVKMTVISMGAFRSLLHSSALQDMSLLLAILDT